MTRRALFAVTGFANLALVAFAAEAAKTFSFQDPKGVNTVVFKLDSALEPIKGYASGISGDVTFDPANPTNAKGKIIIDVNSMKVPNARMSEKMLSDEMWMNAPKFPTITFAVVSVANVKQERPKAIGEVTPTRTFTANVTGDFTMKGVTKRMTVPMSVNYFENGLGKRVGNLEGDLMVVRTKFTIDRTEFGVDGKTPFEIVNNKVEIEASLAAGAPKK